MKENTQSEDQESGGNALRLLTLFDKSFTKMGQCWFYSLLDARAIEKWLQTGADMAASFPRKQGTMYLTHKLTSIKVLAFVHKKKSERRCENL